MRTLTTLDLKNYDPSWRRYRRFAVRAVIQRGNQLLLVHSSEGNFYKFPGGGIEKGESHADTLIRETLEETGLIVIPDSIREYGKVREIRRSVYRSQEIFDQTSYYYFARVEEEMGEMSLDRYEAELGFHLTEALPAAAYQANLQALSRELQIDLTSLTPREAYREHPEALSSGRGTFLLREAYVMELLRKRHLRRRHTPKSKNTESHG